MRLFCRARGVKNSEENIHWNVVKGTFIGMSESHRGITSGAETATNVPFDSRNNRRTIPLATNTRTPLGNARNRDKSRQVALPGNARSRGDCVVARLLVC